MKCLGDLECSCKAHVHGLKQHFQNLKTSFPKVFQDSESPGFHCDFKCRHLLALISTPVEACW